VAEERDLILSQIGLRITRRRQILGITQSELAARSGITRTSISFIEGGNQNLTIDTLCKLANALGTTVVELLGGTPGSPSRR
jgi:transcriptional regulator with XRE-family HTH domain